MLQLSTLHKAYGTKVLFDKVTWQVREGERIGLCGPNGAGKTTLLKMLARLEEPDSGTITHPSDLTVGYLPQDGLRHAGHTLFFEASSAFADLLSLQAEIHQLENKLTNTSVPTEEQERILARYSEAHEIFRHNGGYDIEARVTAVLRGLGFAKSDFQRQTDAFSGGWQMRIALAKLLLGRPRLLLMDEPTNHLDLEARNWLEDFLFTYPHAVVLVSHDRFFLDSVVTAIAEIGLKTLTTFPGTYSNYLIDRDARLKKQREQKRSQDEEIARLQAFIDRFRYKATKAAQVQSRVKMLAKIKPIEVPPERKRVHFTFPAAKKSGRIVLELQNIRKTYDTLTVFDGVSVHVERNDRIALVGPNGAGKSTLMRLLAGTEAPDTGQRIEGQNIVAQYFAQDEAAILDATRTVYETLVSGSPVHMVPSIRNILGGFLFEGDDIYKRVEVLSGGERTRLAVARMLLRPSNILLLDEPTNHLDIDSTNVLLDALIDYDGTLIFVSHDRYFVDQLANKILEIGNAGAALYPGTYEEFRWSVQQRDDGLTAGVTTPARPHVKPSPIGKAAQHRRNQVTVRRRERRLHALHTRIEDLEQRISEREKEVRALEAVMAEPSFYDDNQHAKTTIAEHQKLMWQVGDFMNQWEALQVEVSEINHTDQKP